MCSCFAGSVPLSSISARTSVRSAVSQGRIEEAVKEINTILPTLLEQNPSLLLQLQQQQLVELIRADKIEEALTFARTHLRAGSAHQVCTSCSMLLHLICSVPYFTFHCDLFVLVRL